ncbi:3543_t:CDS:2, partial [Cetraspora pellucida]
PNDDLISKSKAEFSGKSRKNVLTKSLEKFPIFFIHITCPTENYDISLDPAKNIIEFENWPKILDLLSGLVTQFLLCHGFLTQDIVTSNVKNFTDSTNNHKKSRIRPGHNFPLSFEDITHIKSGGKKQYVFRDEELKAGLSIPKNMEDSENILATSKKTVKIRENEYTKWTEPQNCTKARIDRSRLRTSNYKNTTGGSHATPWAKNALEKWVNPVFQSYEAPIPLLRHISTCNKQSSVKSSFFPCNNFAQSCFVEHRFSKKDFAQAQVIGQADDKFIVCKLSYSRVVESDNKNCTQQQILVLVDQHAADER